MKENGREIRDMELVCLKCYLGIYYYTNGEKYDGEWKLNAKEGFGNFRQETIGIWYHSNGGKYEGLWKNNKKHGKGTYILTIGIYTYDNGDVYEGKYRDGRKHGKGRFWVQCRNLLRNCWKQVCRQMAARQKEW
eukprot:TRINITY_DN3115_c0_g1_i12.p3 TRINITY_DN3115_c0_g1~~TRINITY_DN3115_c0_g1_i12.p3  ORF type:complete len:134 (-),score=12.67 TRINITY_DN3115_c0_g1_i12:716-1117(-)